MFHTYLCPHWSHRSDWTWLASGPPVPFVSLPETTQHRRSFLLWPELYMHINCENCYPVSGGAFTRSTVRSPGPGQPDVPLRSRGNSQWNSRLVRNITNSIIKTKRVEVLIFTFCPGAPSSPGWPVIPGKPSDPGSPWERKITYKSTSGQQTGHFQRF